METACQQGLYPGPWCRLMQETEAVRRALMPNHLPPLVLLLCSEPLGPDLPILSLSGPDPTTHFPVPDWGPVPSWMHSLDFRKRSPSCAATLWARPNLQILPEQMEPQISAPLDTKIKWHLLPPYRKQTYNWACLQARALPFSSSPGTVEVAESLVSRLSGLSWASWRIP